MGPVVDIEIPKALPTNELVIVHDVPTEKFDDYCGNRLPQIKLPDTQQEPFVI
jgi:hypothetical protein